jgi:hypothetical protein
LTRLIITSVVHFNITANQVLSFDIEQLRCARAHRVNRRPRASNDTVSLRNTCCRKTQMETMQAMVNPRLLTKANRLFTGTQTGRIIEILQNARRAGATRIEITNHEGVVTVRDNGRGIDDFARLLDLGSSGWESDLESSEDPAGVGLFCLAPRRLLIRSNYKQAIIDGDGWTGAAVVIRDDPNPQSGTILEFEDERWSHPNVEPQAVFCGVDVVVDGEPCDKLPFVSDKAVHHPDLGCRIEVRELGDLHTWHRSCGRSGYGRDNAIVNFHGQVVGFDCHPVSEHHLYYLIDMTAEPTDIRLMLPARTQLVENDAWDALTQAIELDAYRYLQRRGHHRLPYSQYLRARKLGIDLPEATPTFSVGLLDTGEAPEPVEITMPEGFPLSGCYRFDPGAPGGHESDEANVHLLAALGKFERPFVPVAIRGCYDGYAWAKLPTIGKVELRTGRQLHAGSVWMGTLTCVESIVITAHASDGRTFSSSVCMAAATNPPNGFPTWAEEHVIVTPETESRLCPSEIWHHLGGAYDEGDTFETQEYDFGRELDRFWLEMLGPDERLRRAIVDVLTQIEQPWRAVKAFPNGKVRIKFKDRSVKTIRSPRVYGINVSDNRNQGVRS